MSNDLKTPMLEQFVDAAITFAKESGGFICLAVVIGVYQYRYLTPFFKLILLQAVFAIISYFSAYAVVLYQQSHSMTTNNHWLYNIYILIEVGLLLCASSVIFEKFQQRKWIYAAMILFVAIYMVEIMADGFWQLANISLVAGGFMIVFVYQIILFKKMRESSLSLWMLPEFWVCLGISLYFACNVPFIGLLPQLLEYDADLVSQLFYITEVLAIMRYLFFAISLYLTSRKQTVISG